VFCTALRCLVGIGARKRITFRKHVPSSGRVSPNCGELSRSSQRPCSKEIGKSIEAFWRS
jgi:hypothetical protein